MASFDILRRKDRNNKEYRPSALFIYIAFPSFLPTLAKAMIVHACMSSELGPALAIMVWSPCRYPRDRPCSMKQYSTRRKMLNACLARYKANLACQDEWGLLSGATSRRAVDATNWSRLPQYSL